ncbi:MAG TPA: radical SAM protein, partial [Bacillota bacterium]|nr:radical SAM protein [Bacillota bacterium]
MEDYRRRLEVNILPQKYCNFDCIFRPVGRSQNKTDTPKPFGALDRSLIELEQMIEKTKAEFVFFKLNKKS